MVYDYNEAVREDIKEYIKENYTLEEARELQEDNGDLYDNLFIEDSVTGNASGSYYCNAWKAEEAIAHNMDLLAEALKEFCCEDVSVLEKGAEWCDVTIRCYILSQELDEAINEAVEEMEEEAEGVSA